MQNSIVIKNVLSIVINSLTPRRTQVSPAVPFHRNFDFILRRDHRKISYERRAYESVDEKSLS